MDGAEIGIEQIHSKIMLPSIISPIVEMLTARPCLLAEDINPTCMSVFFKTYKMLLNVVWFACNSQFIFP